MTEESLASTSSINPATSEPFDKLTRLGEKIVLEMGLAESTDTVGRWMAHRIAELMETARAAHGTPSGAAAAKACQDAILALWQHRSAWPHGWPPPLAGVVAAELAAASSSQSGRGRGSFIAGPQELHHQIIATFVDLIVSSFDSTTERDWLERFGDFLGEEERALLKRVTEVPSLRRLVSAANEDPASRLKDLAQQYQAAVVAIVTAVESVFRADGHSTD